MELNVNNDFPLKFYKNYTSVLAIIIIIIIAVIYLLWEVLS